MSYERASSEEVGGGICSGNLGRSFRNTIDKPWKAVPGTLRSLAAISVALVCGIFTAAAEDIGDGTASDASWELRYAIPTARRPIYQDRLDEIQGLLDHSQNLEKVKIVFLGDSITDYWLMAESPWKPGVHGGAAIWEENFGAPNGNYFALNLGLSGDRTEHVLHRLLAVKNGGLGHLDNHEIQPLAICLMIGINNTWAVSHPTADSIAEGIDAISRRLHELRPNARIIVTSLLPTQEVDRNTKFVWPVNNLVRSEIERDSLAGKRKYFDLSKHFIGGDGRQLSRLFHDGLHLNEDGYRTWADAFLPILAKDLSEQSSEDNE